MDQPKVSICIPAYHASRFIAETLASVRAQDFTDWEIIVTEDGSDDGTAAIVSAFAETVGQSARYERHTHNQGLPATRNTGITSAKSEWIALLDSDDLWTADHLSSLMETAEKTGADLIHGGSILFDSDSGRDLEVRAPSPELLEQFPLSLFDARYIIQPASVMLKKSLWEKVGGFNPKFRFVEDREMWLRCARAGARFAYTGRETCRYRKHAAALSARSAEMAEASAAVFDQHLDWDAIPKKIRIQQGADSWTAAARMRLRADPSLARKYFSRAWEIRPSLRLAIYRSALLILPLRR